MQSREHFKASNTVSYAKQKRTNTPAVPLLQESQPLPAGQCARLTTEQSKDSKAAVFEYRVPILGHVATYFKDPISIRGLEGFKKDWSLPVKILVDIAKVV